MTRIPIDGSSNLPRAIMIVILRIGHRPGRDERVSTHCGLVSRALGASSIIYSGEKDEKLIESVKNVVDKWGGRFYASYEENYRNVIKTYKKKKYVVIHLTMYGMPLQQQITKLRKCKNLLIVIGAEKVPPEVYQMADYNIAVTNQPHSEIAALALLLHEYQKGKELNKLFPGAKIKLKPCAKGKSIIEK